MHCTTDRIEKAIAPFEQGKVFNHGNGTMFNTSSSPELQLLNEIIIRATPVERAKIVMVLDTICGSLDEPSYNKALHEHFEQLLQKHRICETTFFEYAS